MKKILYLLILQSFVFAYSSDENYYNDLIHKRIVFIYTDAIGGKKYSDIHIVSDEIQYAKGYGYYGYSKSQSGDVKFALEKGYLHMFAMREITEWYYNADGYYFDILENGVIKGKHAYMQESKLSENSANETLSGIIFSGNLKNGMKSPIEYPSYVSCYINGENLLFYHGDDEICGVTELYYINKYTTLETPVTDDYDKDYIVKMRDGECKNKYSYNPSIDVCNKIEEFYYNLGIELGIPSGVVPDSIENNTSSTIETDKNCKLENISIDEKWSLLGAYNTDIEALRENCANADIWIYKDGNWEKNPSTIENNRGFWIFKQ